MSDSAKINLKVETKGQGAANPDRSGVRFRGRAMRLFGGIAVVAFVAVVAGTFTVRSLYLWDSFVLKNEGEEEVCAVRVELWYGEGRTKEFFCAKIEPHKSRAFWVKDCIERADVDLAVGEMAFMYEVRARWNGRDLHAGKGWPPMVLRIVDGVAVGSEWCEVTRRGSGSVSTKPRSE